jgi:NADPH-dependent FMN reductase
VASSDPRQVRVTEVSVRALILSGAPPGDGELDAIQATLQSELVARGHTAESRVLRDMAIAYCQGCFDCWMKTPGVCRTHDDGPDLARACINSDVLLLLTPITFGGYSSHLKKGMDRLIGLISPFFTRIHGEVHHKTRYPRYPSVVMIGVLPQRCAEEEAVFHDLVRRNAINMHAPWCISRVCYRGASSGIAAEILRLVEGQERAA